MLRDRLAAEFMLDVIYETFGYSYECVEDEEWNETIFALLATDFPNNTREVYEVWLINRVTKQARDGEWEDALLHNFLEEYESY